MGNVRSEKGQVIGDKPECGRGPAASMIDKDSADTLAPTEQGLREYVGLAVGQKIGAACRLAIGADLICESR